MSIATLKRKTAAKYNNSSVNHPQFSLNGTYRAQGYIGQTSLSQSFPRTLMNGNTARGSGGCCGTYPSTNNIVSGIANQNDSTVIKPSVLSSKGRIAKRYPWISNGSSADNGFEYMHVQRDDTHSLNTQSTYIETVINKSMAETISCKDNVATYCDEVCNIVAEPSITGAVPYSFYLRYGLLKKNCTTSMPSYVRNAPALPIDVCSGVKVITTD
jgi:hypothetical protein